MLKNKALVAPLLIATLVVPTFAQPQSDPANTAQARTARGTGKLSYFVHCKQSGGWKRQWPANLFKTVTQNRSSFQFGKIHSTLFPEDDPCRLIRV